MKVSFNIMLITIRIIHQQVTIEVKLMMTNFIGVIKTIMKIKKLVKMKV